MPDRPHHTAKMKSCVDKVMADGKSEESAYAICTTSLKDAGEPVFEAAEEGTDLRELHLLGSTGRIRRETMDGKQYMVVPVTALMEGVIHAVNAPHPEFVPLTTLQKAAASFNGRPVMLGHPVKNGRQCSANDPEILNQSSLGIIFNSRVEGIKLLMDTWLEEERVKKLAPGMYDRLLAEKLEEVSVGAYVQTGDQAGEHFGKQYKAPWLGMVGDHLAYLPNGRGACSIEMGCGAHRAAAMRMCEDTMELEILNENLKQQYDMQKKVREILGSKKVKKLRNNSEFRAACSCKEGKGNMTPDEKAEVIAALIAHDYSDFKDDDVTALEALPEGRLEELRAAADKREEDAEAKKKLETDNRQLSARVKVVEEKLRTAEATPTEEEWLKRAPDSIRTLLEAQKIEIEEKRTELVNHLRTAQSEFTEDDLKAMDMKTLERWTKVFPKAQPDFRGRGIPQAKPMTTEQKLETYAPPDSYAEGLKALQEKNQKATH